MASSTIVYNQPINATSVNISNNYSADVILKDGSAMVQDKSYKTGKINTSTYALAKPVESKRSVKVSQRLPFYISFQNVTISGYGPSNPAPIGIAVVGFSNYIL
jgi:hypothetical protein